MARKDFFFSVIVAPEGGETPITDSRRVYKKIDNSLREKFERSGILYVRNYTTGIDLCRQEVLQTDQKADLDNYCDAHGIEFKWNDRLPELTTKQ